MTRHFLICIYAFKSCTEKPMSYLNNNKKINLHVKQNKFWLFRARNYIWQVLFPPLCIMYFNKGMWTQVNDEKTYIKQLKNIFQNNYLKYFLKLTYDSKCMMHELWDFGIRKDNMGVIFLCTSADQQTLIQNWYSYNEIHRYQYFRICHFE